MPANEGDAGSIPGSGRSPGERRGNPLQYSCLGNPTDRGAWWATVHGVTEELDTTELLSTHAQTSLTLYQGPAVGLMTTVIWTQVSVLTTF